MRISLRNLLYICAVLFGLMFFGLVASAENINPNNDGNGYATLVPAGTAINFDCTGCNAEVTSSQLTGYAWGVTTGWINFQPTGAGVSNDGNGNLTGYGWGVTSGWFNFSPTGGGVTIDSNGYWNGYAWAQNFGWVQFDCSAPGSQPCVQSEWNTTTDSNGPNGTQYGCHDPEANNYEPDLSENNELCEYDTPPGGGGNIDYCELDFDVSGMVDSVDGGMLTGVTGSTSADDIAIYDLNNDGVIDASDLLILLGAIGEEGCDVEDDEGGGGDPDDDIDYCELDFDVSGMVDPVDKEMLTETMGSTSADDIAIYDLNNDGAIDASDLLILLGAIGEEGCDVDDDEGGEGDDLDYGCPDPEALNYLPDLEPNPELCLYEIIDNGPGGGGGPPDNGDPPGGGGPPDDGPEGNPIGTAGTVGVALVALMSVLSPLVEAPVRAASVLPEILRWLNGMFTGFGARRRKKPWGTVYDSMTKQPLDPVYVSLQNLAGEEVQSAITDIDGRYGFLVGPNTYRMVANKTDYAFPSKKMEGHSKDVIYDNLYFGQNISVKEQDEVVNKDIPLDSVNFNWNEFEKKRTGVMKFHSNAYLLYVRIAQIVFWVGLGFSVFAAWVSPSVFNFVILGVYAFVLVLRIFGVGGFRSKGIIREADRTPLSFGVVRVFSAKLNREVRKAVTGPTGSYFILLPKGEYYFKIEKRFGEGDYREVYRSTPKKYTRGFLNKKLRLK